MQMIVHDPCCLHERVHRGRSDEAPTPPLQLPTQCDRFGGLREFRQGGARHRLGSRPGSWLKLPDERRQRSKFLPKLACSFCVVEGRLDLPAMPHDPGVRQKSVDATCVETRHLIDFKVGKSIAEVFPLVENRQPTQARLKPLQTQLLEDPSVVACGTAPLLVVVRAVRFAAHRPPAAGYSISSSDNCSSHSQLRTKSRLGISMLPVGRSAEAATPLRSGR